MSKRSGDLMLPVERGSRGPQAFSQKAPERLAKQGSQVRELLKWFKKSQCEKGFTEQKTRKKKCLQESKIRFIRLDL